MGISGQNRQIAAAHAYERENRMKNAAKIFSLLLALSMFLSLAPAAFADEAAEAEGAEEAAQTWEEMVEAFVAESGNNSETVGMGYINLVTGEEHYYNADKFMVSGSMYKVPINMYFSNMVYNGEISWDTSIGGVKYSTCIMETIVNSNNDYAQKMWDYLGGYQTYRRKIAPIMGEDPDTADEMFYKNNFFTPREMIYCLNELYTNSEQYPQVIDYMLKAEPNKYFKARSHSYEIAHKYGYLSTDYHFYLDDCAIIYTDEPIAIVVFTDNAKAPYEVLSDYCDLMIEYAETTTAARLAEEEAEREAELAREAEEAEQARLAEEAVIREELEQKLSAPAETTAEETEAAAAAERAAAEEAAAAAQAAAEERTEMFYIYLLVGIPAAAAVIWAIVMAVKGKIQLPFAIAAIVAAAAAIVICPGALSADTSTAVIEEDPQENITQFMDAIVAGDYDVAYACLDNYSTLGLENEPTDEAGQMMLSALRDSYDYALSDTCAVDGKTASQKLNFQYLDLTAISEDLKTKTEEKVEALVKELSSDEVYDENGEYLASFTDMAYMQALSEVLQSPLKYYAVKELTLSLSYSDGWRITADTTLINALCGGAVY